MLAAVPPPPGPYDDRVVVRDHYVALVPSGAAQAMEGRTLTPPDLAGKRLIGLESGTGLEPLARRLDEAGFAFGFAMRSSSIETVRTWVARGFGIAIVPSRLVTTNSATRTVDLAADLRIEARWVEGLDAADAAAALQQGVPEVSDAHSDRRDRPEPGDDNAAGGHSAILRDP